MTVGLRGKRDLEVAKNGSEDHPIRERVGLRLFLSLRDVTTDKVGKVFTVKIGYAGMPGS